MEPAGRASEPTGRVLEPSGRLGRGGGCEKKSKQNRVLPHKWWYHRSSSPTVPLPKNVGIRSDPQSVHPPVRYFVIVSSKCVLFCSNEERKESKSLVFN